jgi:hypothetical protein
MTPEGRASESMLPGRMSAESSSPSLPGDGRTPWFGGDPCSRELIERQRALVRDIREAISQTRRIIDSTREQLDAFNILVGKSRPAAAREGLSPSDGDS